jgi:AmmeMemoRadiSam system protein B
MAVRPPAVAGLFYPAQPTVLADLIDRLVDAIEVPSDDRLAPAYVVPHAGYRYSGPTAAHVYARLRVHADRVKRVVLVGPAHRVPLTGCAVPAARSWRTPFGEVPVDPAADALAADDHAVSDDGPHAPEHSLEVQVPFLQRLVGLDLPVLPIVVGASPVDDVVATVTAAVEAAAPGTVLLCSTDLSHYLTEQAARQQDERTVQAILDLAPDRIGVRDACGAFALRGLLGWASHRRLIPELLHIGTSADTAGDRDRVVGYSAFALSSPLSSPSPPPRPR